MKRYRLIYRGCRDAYYCFDTHTKKRESLGINDANEAQRLVDARNEAVRHVAMNLQIAQGYLWTCSRPGGDVFYRWETSRAAECLGNIIPVDFKGTVQCDGYSAYRAFANRRHGTIAWAGCWAHVRRKFHEALEQSPKTAGWMMR